MTVPPPEYGEEDRLRQRPGRVRQQSADAAAPNPEDVPEREVEQHERQGREVGYLDPENHEAHAPGTVCERCGAVIATGEDARRLTDGQWIHEACPAGSAARELPRRGG